MAFYVSVHFVLQLLLILLVANLRQYAAHRAYHEIPFLWRFHSVRHSAKHLEWTPVGQHMFELIATRCSVLTPIFILGYLKRYHQS